MNEDEHLKHHQLLHKHLDELFADYIEQHPKQHEFLKMPFQTLMEWSFKQSQSPDHPVKK